MVHVCMRATVEGVDVPSEPVSEVRVRAAAPLERPRGRTLPVVRLAKRDLDALRELYPPEEHADLVRPRTRGDCATVPRPCPWVACRHHLYLDVLASGNIKVHVDGEPDELPSDASCALDVAERGGLSLEDVGTVANLSRERVRQVEHDALAKLRAGARTMPQLAEAFGAPPAKRRLPVVQHEDERAGDEVFDAERFASDELDVE